ncbi:MAG: exopolyphosphatase [Adlercreutzia equolifaciens]
MGRLGVIDLGSNSVRLVVYETKREDAVKPFRTLVDEKKMAGLAAYVTDGALSNAGIARAVAVLGDLLKLADNLNCARVDIFATAVLRNCANSQAATAAIRAAIDHKVRVLSAREEAHLGFVGASIGAPLAAGTLIDVGGGSTELTALAADGDHAGISIPFGCVLAYANYVRCIIPTPAECRTIADAFRKELQALPNLEGYRSERLYGIGGSVRALAKMVAAVWGDDTRPKSISRKDMEGLADLLQGDVSVFAHRAESRPRPCSGLVPGMIIVRTLAEELGAAEVIPCKYGIREGTSSRTCFRAPPVYPVEPVNLACPTSRRG